MKSWKTLKTETIEANKYVTYQADDFQTAEGVQGRYYYHQNNNATATFVQKDRSTFIMVREYRYLFDRESIGCVQAAVDIGESPEASSKRESREETGYEPAVVIHVGWFSGAAALSKERVDVYIARDLIHKGQQPEDFEQIDVLEMTADDIDTAIASNEIWDGHVIAAWTKVKMHLAKEGDL